MRLLRPGVKKTAVSIALRMQPQTCMSIGREMGLRC